MNETYIRMCREAVELQEAWEPKKGDMVLDLAKMDFNAEYGHVSKLDVVSYIERMHMSRHPYSLKQEYYWLPRQEDLQEIHNTTPALIKKFVDSNYLFFHDQQEHGFEDWDLIWLCYVMYIVYDKTWNGTTWGAIL